MLRFSTYSYYSSSVLPMYVLSDVRTATVLLLVYVPSSVIPGMVYYVPFVDPPDTSGHNRTDTNIFRACTRRQVSVVII